LAQKKQFGKSSEISQDQLGLFNELEEVADVDAEPDQEKETLCDTRKKPKRRPLPKDLPREIIVHDISTTIKPVMTADLNCIKWVKKKANNWILTITPLLMRVYQRMHTIQLQQRVINADEAALKVIHEDKNKCYMWVYCTGTDSPSTSNIGDENKPLNIVLYDYKNNRSGQCTKDYLRGFKGDLQVDGYVGYEKTDATLAGCMPVENLLKQKR